MGFGLILIKDGYVLLGRRHDDPDKAKSLLNGAGTWTMPGGKLQFGETFEEGGARELKEETGMTAKRIKLIAVNNDIVETAHFVTVGLLVEEFIGEPQVLEPDEITCWE